MGAGISLASVPGSISHSVTAKHQVCPQPLPVWELHAAGIVVLVSLNRHNSILIAKVLPSKPQTVIMLYAA
jgi:hypothetical protein